MSDTPPPYGLLRKGLPLRRILEVVDSDYDPQYEFDEIVRAVTPPLARLLMPGPWEALTAVGLAYLESCGLVYVEDGDWYTTARGEAALKACRETIDRGGLV